MAAADSSQDYDVPAGLSLCRCDDNDVELGVGDYDLLSPPQRPVSDVDGGASSNRSSVTSVVSGGSLSSGCTSIRSAHQSPSVGVGQSAGALASEPHLAARRCLSEATSDTSADSGIALQAVSSSAASTINGDYVHRNGTPDDADCLDYDVPMANVNDTEVVSERRVATPGRRCQSSVKHIRPAVVSDQPRRRDDGRCADDVRRRRVEELRDCVLRSVQRFLAWTGRATGGVAGADVVAVRQCNGQAKLAGLAVRTSLRQLVAVVDGNPSELLRPHVDRLNKSLLEIDRRVDSLIASGSESRSHRLAGSTAGGRRAATESTMYREQLMAVAEIVADVPEQVMQFADFVVANPAVVLRPPDYVDVVPTSSSSDVVRTLPPPPPQRRDNHQRDKPPQSPPAVVDGGDARARRPPIGKPPPVKPKPPKSVSWNLNRPPQTPVQPRPAGVAVTSNGPAIRPNSATQQRRVAELNTKNERSTDGWNEDDCDYVSIVREVEREMQSLGKPATKDRPPATDVRTPTSLNDDDRELLAFFSAQVSAHAADVDAATAEFYRCCPPSPPPASADAFVRRSRFVVLAAHRLVYVGDVIARHVTDGSMRDRVAAAANMLCDRLKAVVMATRDAAIATAEYKNAAAAADIRQTMVDSVRQATDECRRLCDIISSAACQ